MKAMKTATDVKPEELTRRRVRVLVLRKRNRKEGRGVIGK